MSCLRSPDGAERIRDRRNAIVASPPDFASLHPGYDISKRAAIIVPAFAGTR
jgi:hypothetical protein